MALDRQGASPPAVKRATFFTVILLLYMSVAKYDGVVARNCKLEPYGNLAVSFEGAMT